MKKLGIVCALLLCLTLSAAFAQEDTDISYRQLLGITEAPTATPAPTPGASGAPDAPDAPQTLLDGSQIIRITVGGRVSIGDGTPAQSDLSIYDKELRRQNGDVSFMWRNVKDYFTQDDYTLLCLQSALTSRASQASGAFAVDSDHARAMAACGVNAVVLQGDMCAPFGADALSDTTSALSEAGLLWASDGIVSTTTVYKTSICTVSYDARGGNDLTERITREISEYSSIYHVVIACFLWGDARDYVPNARQQALARAAIDAGASLVVGQGSTHINPIECYQERYIVYSMGNLSCAAENKPSDMSTFLFQVRFRINGSDIEPYGFRVVPCRASSRTDYNDFAPTPYIKQSSLDSMMTILEHYGQQLASPIPQYLMEWEY